ncbi:protein of unknown function (DUF4129) [Candidatus Fervidibacteria bacterium JGI MDM2 SSWTFF-3-K9]
MRLSVLTTIAIFVVACLGQASEIGNQTPHSSPRPLTVFNIIAEQLQKAKEEKSVHARQKTLSRIEGLLKRLPRSTVTERLEDRLKRAFRSSVMSDEAEEAIDEAIEIAEAADKLFRQTSLTVDPELAQSTLQRVLNSREFQVWNPFTKFLQRLSKWLEKPINWLVKLLSPLFRWLAKFFSPVFEWLSKVLEALGAWFWHWWQLLNKISPILAWAIAVLLTLLSVAMFSSAIVKWWRKRQRIRGEISWAETLIVPEQLLLEAENDARRGDYLTALRKAYKALLLFLDRIGLIRFREQRTNWEYLSEVRRKASDEFAQRFQEVTNIFDLCFYARVPVTAEDFVNVRQFVEETRRQARSLLSQP